MNYNDLNQCLKETMSLDSQRRKIAENYILDIENKVGYCRSLFDVIKAGLDLEVKVQAAIIFKNFIKRNWQSDEANDDKILSEERAFIRDNIIELMLINPPMIQNQLSEAVSIIGKQDFPDQWSSLLPQLVMKIKEGNFNIINGVLRTCDSLFERYNYEGRSDDLWRGIKEAIEKMATPLTELLQQTIVLIGQHSSDKNALSVLWSSLLLISKIFFSLNCQDLPEYFEDNMMVWMKQFHIILTSTAGILEEVGDEPSVVEEVKDQICNILSLYAGKYQEEFAEYLNVFLEDVYTMILSTTASPRFDNIVTSGLHFLGIVADRPQYHNAFVTIVNIQQLCQQIIIPNIEFQLSDQETFEENAEEYIRRDIEGSNAHTRRKSSCELVKSLNRFQENQIVANFGQYIQQLLANYSENPSKNWKMKDSALFLVTSVASRGETERLGVTVITELVDINSFYKGHIFPELQSADGNPVIKADCIKYLMTFRSLLTPDDLRLAINLVIKFANHPSHVVHSYAAAAINKLLMVRENPSSNVAIIAAQNITSPTTFITSLCATMSIAGSEDNVYSMQAITRTLSTLQATSLPAMNHLVPFLVAKLGLVVKNPRKPLFNHLLLESIVLSIKLVCADNRGNIQHFEGLLHPILNEVLIGDKDEFIPYAFQMFSLMLDYHDTVSGAYIQLFPFLMHPALWAKSDNVPALIRLLLSYLEKARDGSIIADKVTDLVAIFQRLNNSRALDSFGFSLLTAVLLYVPRQHTEMHMKPVFTAIFQRLSRNKTAKYLRGFLLFFTSLIHVYSASEIVALINSLQNNLFQMTLDSAVLPAIKDIRDVDERRVCVSGIARLIECPEVVSGQYGQYWPQIVSRVVDSLAQGAGGDQTIDAHFVDVNDSTNSHTALNQLMFLDKKRFDGVLGVRDPRLGLVAALQSLSAKDGPRFEALYRSLEESTRATITAWMA